MLKQLFIIVGTCLVCMIDEIHCVLCVRYFQGSHMLILLGMCICLSVSVSSIRLHVCVNDC